MRLRNLVSSAVFCCALAGCADVKWPPQLAQLTEEKLTLKETSYDQLPGWTADAQGEAAVALQRSCVAINKKDGAEDIGAAGLAGKAAAWQKICADLARAVPLTNDGARFFFEAHFTPYEMAGRNGTEGLFTGYYEPTLHGSLQRHGKYQIPVYSRPNDLVTIDLGAFSPDLQGKNIVGRVKGDKRVVPYYTREQIEAGALAGSDKVVWVDNAVDAFFLHIQGSGRIVMEDGKVLRVGYAAENGQPYTAIGKKLVEQGALQKENVSMQSIRDWLEKNPDKAAEVMNLDASFIFFRKIDAQAGEGPLGAEGVPLTPERSLAVDKKQLPYGVPVFLDAQEPDGGGNLQRLMVAQDTGGAITGAVRGDFFWGAGDRAAHKAGLMKSRGRAWLLLPSVPEEAEAEPSPTLLSPEPKLETPAPAAAEQSPPSANPNAPIWERAFGAVKSSAQDVAAILKTAAPANSQKPPAQTYNP